MASLLDKLQASSTITDTDTIGKSDFFKKSFVAPTTIPMLNVALSGDLAGGLTPGITQWAGPSKHFKTLFGLICAKAYLEKYKDAIILFYDSEFGAGLQYFDNLGIDKKRVLHTPITDIEQLKHDIMVQLGNIERGDHVCIFVDSVGNMASKKEVNDAIEGSDKADMTRAKSLKSLFRMVTPHVTLKNIPMVVINHTYKEIGMFPKDIVGGGTGAYYSSQQIFILGRQQEKEDKTVVGYNFIINVEKSRFVKEKSRIPISVSFEQGISTWSGLLPVALEGGFVVNPTKGYYSVKGGKDKYRESDTNTKAFWMPILLDPEFQAWIQNRYKLANPQLLGSEMTDDDVSEAYEAVTEVDGEEVDTDTGEILEEAPKKTARSTRKARKARKEKTK